MNRNNMNYYYNDDHGKVEEAKTHELNSVSSVDLPNQGHMDKILQSVFNNSLFVNDSSLFHGRHESMDLFLTNVEHKLSSSGHIPWHMSTASFDGYYYYYDGYEYDLDSEDVKNFHLVEPIVLLILCVLGMASNGVALWALSRLARGQRPFSFFFLINFAVVNVLYLLSSCPVSAVSYALADWPFGAVMCRLMNGYMTSVFMCVNMLTLVAAGLDNCIFLLRSPGSQVIRTKSKALATISVIWVSSLVVMVPRIFLYDVMEFFSVGGEYRLCSRFPAGLMARRVDSALLLVVLLLLPLLLLAFFHVRAILWRRGRSDEARCQVGMVETRDRRRMVRLVTASTALFAVGCLPMHVIHMYEDFTGDGFSVLFPNRAILVMGFSFGAAALHPFFLVALSKQVRQQVKNVVTCRPSREGHGLSGSPQSGKTVTPTEQVPQNTDSTLQDEKVDNEINGLLEDSGHCSEPEDFVANEKTVANGNAVTIDALEHEEQTSNADHLTREDNNSVS